jgi:hypothetical protein
MRTVSGPSELTGLCAVIDGWIAVPNFGVSSEEQFAAKLDVLQRIVELARLTNGSVVNKRTMRQLLSLGIDVDSAAGTVRIGAGTSAAYRLDASGWPAPNERMPNELQAPLLLHLLRQYKRPQRVHDTIEGFIRVVSLYLTPFNMESTLTGVPRVMTNTRVAASLLRDWCLIQNSERVRYKSWELTHLGLLAAAALALEQGPAITKRNVTMAYGQYVAEPIRDVLWRLRHIDLLVPTLRGICSENADALGSLEVIQLLVTEYAEVLRRSIDSNDFESCRKAAMDVLGRIEDVIPVASLADDLAVDAAI